MPWSSIWEAEETKLFIIWDISNWSFDGHETNLVKAKPINREKKKYLARA
jgi:hypothetical protein